MKWISLLTIISKKTAIEFFRKLLLNFSCKRYIRQYLGGPPCPKKHGFRSWRRGGAVMNIYKRVVKQGSGEWWWWGQHTVKAASRLLVTRRKWYASEIGFLLQHIRLYAVYPLHASFMWFFIAGEERENGGFQCRGIRTEGTLCNQWATERLNAYTNFPKVIHGLDFDVLHNPLDPFAVMKAEAGKKHGRYLIGDGYIESRTTLS